MGYTFKSLCIRNFKYITNNKPLKFDFMNSNIVILDGQNGYAQDFGEIHYFDDQDICRWEKRFVLEKTLGIRTFWDLQQNQDVQTEEEWQENMIEIEERVSTIPEFQSIAFFHHVFYHKEI